MGVGGILLSKQASKQARDNSAHFYIQREWYTDKKYNRRHILPVF